LKIINVSTNLEGTTMPYNKGLSQRLSRETVEMYENSQSEQAVKIEL
jgi:hypothetical protein